MSHIIIAELEKIWNYWLSTCILLSNKLSSKAVYPNSERVKLTRPEMVNGARRFWKNRKIQNSHRGKL